MVVKEDWAEGGLRRAVSDASVDAEGSTPKEREEAALRKIMGPSYFAFSFRTFDGSEILAALTTIFDNANIPPSEGLTLIKKVVDTLPGPEDGFAVVKEMVQLASEMHRKGNADNE